MSPAELAHDPQVREALAQILAKSLYTTERKATANPYMEFNALRGADRTIWLKRASWGIAELLPCIADLFQRMCADEIETLKASTRKAWECEVALKEKHHALRAMLENAERERDALQARVAELSLLISNAKKMLLQGQEPRIVHNSLAGVHPVEAP